MLWKPKIKNIKFSENVGKSPHGNRTLDDVSDDIPKTQVIKQVDKMDYNKM